MYKDVSYLIIKQIEKEKLGIKIKSVISNEQQQYVSISFVNNMNLFTDSSNTKLKIQQIINICDKLYGAIGGYVEGSKM